MGHLYHGYVRHNQRVLIKNPPVLKHSWWGFMGIHGNTLLEIQ